MKTKTLLYLASGPIIPEYQQLPFGKMIFVDRNQQQMNFQDDRFEFIRADALFAIERLIEKNIKIDYLVSVNEGLWGGGGDYPVLSDFMLGYLSPILSDEFFLICDPIYYRALPMTLNPQWGFTKSVVPTEDPSFINPSLFSYSQRESNRISNSDYGKVFRLERNRTVKNLIIRDGLNCKLIYGSIWDDASKLDMIGINLISRQEIRGNNRIRITIDAYFRQKGVYDLNQKSISDIIQFAQLNGHQHLGLSPWMDGDYDEVINYIRSCDLGGIESITFYHLRKKDFAMLYQME
jgi:hypothetical protein